MQTSPTHGARYIIEKYRGVAQLEECALWEREVAGSSPVSPTHSAISWPQGKHMGCYVYILKGRKGYLYTGITWNLKKRLLEHNKGIKSKIPGVYRPFKIVYFEAFLNRTRAAKREKEIKGWRRSKKEKLIGLH